MIYLRNKLYIKWTVSKRIDYRTILNLNCFINKINKFKLVVLEFDSKLSDAIDISKKLTNKISLIKVNGACLTKTDDNKNINFPNLTNDEVFKKAILNEEIKDEKINNELFICTCLVDSIYINNTNMYYGVCKEKKFAGNLMFTVPAIKTTPKKCNQKRCCKNFTKTNLKSVKCKKDVCLENSMFYIKWRLLNACNYHCSYCIRKDYSGNVSFDKLLNNAAKLNQMRIPFRLELIGGEVTLLNLEKLISNITTENLKAIYISTNLSKPVEYFESLHNYLKNRNIELDLSCSLHEDECDKNEFIDKVKYLSNIVERIYLECVSTDKNSNTIKKILALKNIKISLDYLRDRQDNVIAQRKFKPLESKMDIIFNNSVIHHSELSGFVSAGLKCKSNGLYIDVDGNIYGRSCKQKNLISNIDEYDFNIKEDIIDCPNSICNFSSNVEVYS